MINKILKFIKITVITIVCLNILLLSIFIIGGLIGQENLTSQYSYGAIIMLLLIELTAFAFFLILIYIPFFIANYQNFKKITKVILLSIYFVLLFFFYLMDK